MERSRKVIFDQNTRTLQLRKDEACLVVNKHSFALVPSDATDDQELDFDGPDATVGMLAFILEQPTYEDIRKLALEQLIERILARHNPPPGCH
jgi:hypothetical protein